MATTQAAKRLAAGDTTFYQFDPQLGFWGIPNLQHYITYDVQPDKPILASHNSDGNRDAEVEMRPGEKSIVCFGGSHTWGVGVDQGFRYTEYLAEKTGRKVINLGHCSLGLDQICLAVMQKSAKYNPDIIVIEQYPWAVHRVLSPYVNGFVRPYFSLDSKLELRLHKISQYSKYKIFRRCIGSYHAFRKEFQEFKAGIDLGSGYDPRTDPIFLHWKTRHYDYMYALIDKILGVIRDNCRQRGIKLLFGLGAIQQQFGLKSPSKLVDYDLPRNRFIELLEKNKIAYVDMTEPMLAEHSEKAPVIFFDGHINQAGHELFARVLLEDMKQRTWIKA